MTLLESVENEEKYIIALRRHFHSIPEMSWEEVQTTIDIENELLKIGLKPVRFDGISGVWVEIRGEKVGKTPKVLLLRADIDGVEMTEKTGLSFASRNQGLSHATGRDCHIAMMLGVAKILNEMRKDLKGIVKILFQPAEEVAQGAAEYIKRGVMENVDAVYAVHVCGRLKSSCFDITYGYRMAGADKIDIEIRGNSAHGSLPHLGNDAITASALVINAIQNYVSRKNNPLEPLVISLGTIRGGHQRNTLADYVKLEGTVRTHSVEARERVKRDLKELIQCTAATMGCKAVLDYQYVLPPLSNDARLSMIAYKSTEKLFGEQSIVHLPAVMASEDFAFYTEKVPGVYINIGCAFSDSEEKYDNYSPYFQPDERVLKDGTAIGVQFVIDYFNKEGE